jgi:hypothetical protein
MRPADFKRTTEALGKIPEDLKPHFAAVWGQLEELTNCLLGQASFTDNMNAAKLFFKADHNAEVQLKTKIRGRAERVYLDWTSAYSPWSMCWRIVDETTIGITVFWVDTGVTQASVQITVFGA